VAGDVASPRTSLRIASATDFERGAIRDVIRGDAFEIGRNILITPDDISRRILAAISEDGARVLLDMLTRPAAERASLIGAVAQHADGEWLAGLLTDFEVDEVARLHLVETLRAAISGVTADAGREPPVARREGVEPPTF
jgi:hypothetical protein